MKLHANTYVILRPKFITYLLFFTFAHFSQANTDRTISEQKEQAQQLIQNQPVKFLENKGQIMDMEGNPVPFILFKAEAPGVNVFITEQGLTWQTLKTEEENENNEEAELEEGFTMAPGHEKKEENIKITWERIDVLLKGASIKKENIVKEVPSRTNFNFFYPHCDDGIYGVKEYEKITIKNVYPGIDWVFYNSSDKGFKYDFIVNPGADHKQIELVYKSKKPIRINSKGEIEITTLHGNINENAPVSFVDGKEIYSRFIQNYQRSITVNGDTGYETSIGFDLSPYSANSQLIIDPQLWWGTFLGGNGLDGPKSVDTDNNGNIFVTGYTASTNFPIQNTGTFFQGTSGSGNKAFIMKFDNSGLLLWATYYGGNSSEIGASITVDGLGNIFVTGYTSSPNLPIQNSGTFFQAAGSSPDAFILKFDNAGTRLWATYYGGSSLDEGTSIAVDGAGNVFITGITDSPDFPLQNAGTFFQGTLNGVRDVFILKFDNVGNRLWATYYGGNGYDYGNSIATDGTDNVFVAGYDNSTNFPVQNAGTFFQGANGGGFNDVYILKFDNAGNRLWATNYGGSGIDYGCSVAIDGAGNVFTSGSTNSTNFPLQNSGTFFQGTNAGMYDLFIVKFDNAGNRLWATYYGGSGSENFSTYDNLAIDNCGNVYGSLYTSSTNFPVQSSCDGGYYDISFNGGANDIALLLFDNAGNRLWASYQGGDGNDAREALAVDGNNNLFVAGEWTTVTNSSSYPVTDPGNGAYYDAAFHGGIDDGFLLKFCSATCICSPFPGCIVSNALNVSIFSTSVSCPAQCNGTASITPVTGTSPYTYSWNNTQTTSAITGLCAGTYSVLVSDAASATATATVTITEPIAITMTATATQANCTAGNGTATLNPNGGTNPFTYSWSNGQTASTATGLSAGTYTATVTDASGCSNTQTVTITSSGTFNVTASSTQAGCTVNNGTATVSPGSGTAPYTYTWNNGQTTSTATGLGAGGYTITITDASGCTKTETITVTSSNNNLTVTTTSTPAGCTVSNGIATANASNGTPGYTYSWNNGQTTQTATALGSGSYTVIVTDANGCTQTQTVAVTSSSSLSVTATSTQAGCTTNNGTATANGNNGTTPYTYSWNNGQTSQIATGLPVGNYTATVTDASGCTQTQTVSVTQTSGPIVSASASTSVITGGVSSTLSVAGGGTYLWSPDNNLSCTTCASPTATPSQTTSYCVKVTDSNGCEDSTCITITVDLPCGTIYIPNAFSPNNDTENDLECVFGNCIEKFHITIYNRWGEKIFESNDQTICWDGTYKGKLLNTAVFNYYLAATLISGEVVNTKGNISLVR